jgi:MFS family permease
MPTGTGQPARETAATGRDRRPLLALFGANAISLTGNQLTVLAVPWFVLETTGSATRTGITAFFSILPVVLAAFFGGAVVDRLGYKRASVLSDLASGVTVALIPLLSAVDLLPFSVLLALVFLGALLDAPGATARRALLPDLAEAGGMPIERATSSVQVIQRGSHLLGAPLSGALIALLGPANVLWLDAATFAVSAALVGFAIPATRLPAPAGGESYLASLAVGLRFIRQDRLLLAIVLTLAVTNFLDAAWLSVVAPVFAREAYGSAVSLGLMFGAAGGGSVVGALAYAAVGHRVPRRPIFVAGFILTSLPMLLLATLPPLPVAVAAQAIGGLASGPLNPIIGAVVYERIPAEMRGRILGTLTAGAWFAMPLGVLVAGFALDGVGLRPTLLAIGACYLVTTLTLVVNRAIEGMERPAPAAATG